MTALTTPAVLGAYSQIQSTARQGDERFTAVARQLDRPSTDDPPRESTRRLFYRQDRILDAAKLLASAPLE